MRRLSPTESIATLAWIHPSERDDAAGMDLSGWEDSVWILHSMYENTSLASDVTHDDTQRAAIATGKTEPEIIGDVNLDETTISIGVGSGFSDHPGEGWTRVTWHEYFDRLGRRPGDDQAHPPCFRWFASAGWPVSIAFPNEGSLDGESLRAVASVLSARGLTERCFFYPAALTTGNFDEAEIHEGYVSDVFELVRIRGYSPSNFWSADHSWFVYTDSDLCATRVSGSAELIAALEADPALETLRWTAPSESLKPQR